MRRSIATRSWCCVLWFLLMPGQALAQQGDPPIPAETAVPEAEVGASAAEVAALRQEVEALKEYAAERELAELRADAETAIAAQPDDYDDELVAKTFIGGERSLQALNPEISVVGDVFAQLLYQDSEVYSGTGRSGFFPRVLGFHFQSNLDPFSFTKIAIPITPSGAGLGEAYITWTSVTPWLTMTMGKFRQQFGVVNRWHKPGLDQFDHPLVLREHFGAGGLAQSGLAALIRLPPLWADHMEMELQLTNGENGQLFSGAFFSIPTALGHVKSYWDLNRNTYLEVELSAMAGVNNSWGRPVQDEVAQQLYDEDGQPVTFYDEAGNPISVITQPGATSMVNEDDGWRLSAVGGAHLTLNWEPLRQAKYKGVTWRNEFLYAYKEVVDDGGSRATIKSWGGFSYLQYQLERNWNLGLRGDLTRVFALDNAGKYNWAMVPYLTWWQSPWVKTRFEYNYTNWAAAEAEHRAMLQVTFAVGPHKHERY